MIKKRQYVNAWVNIVSILMFFVTFFTAYTVASLDLSGAFVRAIFSMIISSFVARLLAFLWSSAFSPQEMSLLVKGPPEVPKRTSAVLNELEGQLGQ